MTNFPIIIQTFYPTEFSLIKDPQDIPGNIAFKVVAFQATDQSLACLKFGYDLGFKEQNEKD